MSTIIFSVNETVVLTSDYYLPNETTVNIATGVTWSIFRCFFNIMKQP